MVFTTVHIPDELTARIRASGLTYKVILNLGMDYFENKEKLSPRVGELEATNEKLLKVIDHMKRELWNLQAEQEKGGK